MDKTSEEKPLTLTDLKEHLSLQFVRFYNDILEPRFQVIDRRFDGIDAKLDEHDRRFDHLFKKVEDLHHEYIISNEQMRRLEAKLSQ